MHKGGASESTEQNHPTREYCGGCDALATVADEQIHCSRQKSIEFITESVHFNKADNHVGFYVLFILCVTASSHLKDFM